MLICSSDDTAVPGSDAARPISARPTPPLSRSHRRLHDRSGSPTKHDAAATERQKDQVPAKGVSSAYTSLCSVASPPLDDAGERSRAIDTTTHARIKKSHCLLYTSDAA